MDILWHWLTLILLGVYHGINPAMGWLFAVGLGLQEQSRQAVVRAFTPIALGHALSVAVVVGIIGAAQQVIDTRWLQIGCALTLLGFGAYLLLAQNTHPRWVGMRVGFRDLTWWSFLMSTAHGAGLMLIPVLFGIQRQMPRPLPIHDHAHHDHSSMMAMAGVGMPSAELMLIALHTLAMFAAMAVTALVVYENVGLRLLRTAWLNLDSVWAGALLLAGGVTLWSAL